MLKSTTPISVRDSVNQYLEMIKSSRSSNTHRSYTNALSYFLQILEKQNLIPQSSVMNLKEEAILWLIDGLKDHSPATERLYLTAVFRYYEFLSASNLASLNLPRLRLLIQHRARRYGQRLPQFPRIAIEKMIEYANNLVIHIASDSKDRMRLYRDRALIVTLADSGMRIHEICSLRRGDIDWNEQRAIIIGKGNQQAVVRLSTRTIRSIRDYLNERTTLDGSSGKPIASLPVFCRHDRAAGRSVKPISTTTGRAIVSYHLIRALGKEAQGTITPHSFRHYFVTTVLRGSGGNLKMAQELARHKSISVTQRYAHLSDEELDQGYDEIFNQ